MPVLDWAKANSGSWKSPYLRALLLRCFGERVQWERLSFNLISAGNSLPPAEHPRGIISMKEIVSLSNLDSDYERLTIPTVQMNFAAEE